LDKDLAVPRGVAIPEIRERLFDAMQRLLLRDGPGAVSTRAITTEAGCAKGVLHNHFNDLDGFLAEFVLSRLHTALHDVADLPAKAGLGSVRGNLVRAAEALFTSPVLTAHSVLIFWPSLASRLREAHGHRPPRLDDLVRIFAGYLDAERELGRIRSATDTEAVALALVATVHHLLMSPTVDVAGARDRLGRVVDALLMATVVA
jgi:AcrR family transcriptional regulator